MKKKILLILSIILIAILVFIIVKTNKKDPLPDQTGSWSQINQNIKRDGSWQQIVKNSEFQLGDRSLRGSWSSPDGQEEYYEVEYGNFPCLDGSTVAIPMAVEFARQHLGLSDEDAVSFTNFSTTHYAYESLIMKYPNVSNMISSTSTFVEENHPVDLIIATEPSDEEIALAKENNIEMIIEPICYDAFVFITHKDNPVDNIAIEEIQDIYSGKITNWKDLGGQDKEIKAFQREANSGSQTAMEKLVMKGIPMLPPNMIKVATGMGMLIEVVGEYENSEASIGYTYKYYIDTLYKSKNIKILEVDGYSADNENLRDKTYPFTTNYYGVIRKENKDDVAGKFLEWMLSDEGQKCIDQAGYIPMN